MNSQTKEITIDVNQDLLDGVMRDSRRDRLLYEFMREEIRKEIVLIAEYENHYHAIMKDRIVVKYSWRTFKGLFMVSEDSRIKPNEPIKDKYMTDLAVEAIIQGYLSTETERP